MTERARNPMSRVKHIHFVGIGGAGMSGIAEVLHNLGYQVSGSDLSDSSSTRRLQTMGINVFIGHQSEQVGDAEVLVVSTAIDLENPEICAARDKRIPIVPRAEMLAELMRFRFGIAVAGTHGKTTTTSLIASVLAEGGLDPTYVIGGRLNSSGTHAKLGETSYLVAEADESDASFLHLQPVMAVLTNIDADHMETYGGDLSQLSMAFEEFLQRLPFYGLSVVCIDDDDVRKLLPTLNKPFLTYGTAEDADVRILNIKQEGLQTHFSIQQKGDHRELQVTLNMPGQHNVLNAVAAIAVARELDVTDDAIVKSLLNFQGIARRQQLHGQLRIADKTVDLVDDYGHHPTEIEATVSAMRAAWPDRRLVVIFQPHRYSRTRDLFEDFARVLSMVDVLLMLDIYSAGEAPIAGAEGRDLSRAIRKRGQLEPIFVAELDELDELLPGVIQQDDVLLTMGAGSVASICSGLIDRYGQGGQH